MELERAARKLWWRSGQATASFRRWILVDQRRSESRLFLLLFLIVRRNRYCLLRPFLIWDPLTLTQHLNQPFYCPTFIAALLHGSRYYSTYFSALQASMRFQNFPYFILRFLIDLILLKFHLLFQEHDLKTQFCMHSSWTGKRSWWVYF